MQLPSSCINQAIIMATRLESIESSRVRKKSGKRQLLGTSSSGQEQETEENVFKSIHSFYGERIEDSEEFASAFRNLLLNLTSAITDDDLTKSFQLLKEARNIAKELISGKLFR